jgi:hypothetical protein
MVIRVYVCVHVHMALVMQNERTEAASNRHARYMGLT